MVLHMYNTVQYSTTFLKSFPLLPLYIRRTHCGYQTKLETLSSPIANYIASPRAFNMYFTHGLVSRLELHRGGDYKCFGLER